MEERYRQYFEAMPCYLTVLDRELRIIDANHRFEQDFGKWRGRYCYQVFKNQSEPCEECPVERTFWDGEGHSSASTVKSLSGKQTSVIVYTTPIRNESGDITAVMKMATDITHVTRLTSQFRDGQRRYRQLFEEVPCYISIQDEDLNIVDVNRRFKEDFGGFLGCKCHEIYKHRQNECEVCAVRQTFADGKVHSSEEVVTARDGRQMNVLVYTTPIFDSMGMITRVMEMSTDITPIRELQTQLESMGLLVSSVSHGLKGLLNGLDGGMYLVKTGMTKNNQDRLHRGWEMIERNIQRIRSQVLNILYYTKERPPGREPISTPELCDEILDLLEAKAIQLNIDLKRDIDKDAGEVMADPQSMRTLLINLVENSFDACRVDTKKDEHTVKLTLRGETDNVRFEIEDNGIGMDQETLEKAFSLFFSSKGAKGTGLGLFISNKITKAHGGEIALASELDKGTRFIVTLPRAHSDNSQQGHSGEKGANHGE